MSGRHYSLSQEESEDQKSSLSDKSGDPQNIFFKKKEVSAKKRLLEVSAAVFDGLFKRDIVVIEVLFAFLV